MAQTADEVRADIARTRAQLGQTLNELNLAIDGAKQRIPFYGADRRRWLIAGGVIGATALMAFMALQARNHPSWDPIGRLQRILAPRHGLRGRLAQFVDDVERSYRSAASES